MSYDQALAKAERDCEQAIKERDDAEEWVSQIYFMMLGNSPEWSNLFGFKEAFEEIKEARQVLGDAVRSAIAERDTARGEAERSKDAVLWADGQNGEWPERQPGEGAFYWRKEMMRRAGFPEYQYDKKARTITALKPESRGDGA